MKQFFFLLFSGLLFCSSTPAQSLSLAGINNQPAFQQSSIPDWTHPEKKVHRVCTVRTVGYIAEGTGVLCLYGGVVLVFSSQGNHSNRNGNPDEGTAGEILAVGGFFIACSGVCLAIGGHIHDLHYRHLHKFSLIFPKRNQVGLAYNF